MSITYSLVENALTPDPDDFIAVVQSSQSADTEAIIARIRERGSTITEADLRAVLTELYNTCETLLLEGKRVNLMGLVELFPKIQGIFHGATAPFDPKQHRVDVGANAGDKLRQQVRAAASVVRTEASKPQPNPLTYKDLASGQTNDTVTPATIGTILGARLKHRESAPDEGIYFVPRGGGAGTKVTLVQERRAGRLTFLVPILAPGMYYIEVRTRFTERGDLRTGRLEALLTVA